VEVTRSLTRSGNSTKTSGYRFPNFEGRDWPTETPEAALTTPLAVPGRILDRESAEIYVRELYRFLLNRNDVREDEVAHWTTFVTDSQDPVDLFRRFANSNENKARLLAQQQAQQDAFPSGHFYSPVNNVDEIKNNRHRVFGERALLGVDLNVEGQVTIFNLLKELIPEIPFSDQPDGRFRYHYQNTSYGFGDAAIYWAMLGVFRPERIIEIGSGYTSGLALDAIDYFKLTTQCTFVDPYPALLNKVASPLGDKHTVIAAGVQTIDPELVRSLQANDILFIDSSHVVKAGSDVHFELTELLPRLRTGVIIHFHDVFFPFEYPEMWLVNDRKSWNELYFLNTFLMFNYDFEIIHFNHHFILSNPGQYESLPAEMRRRIKLNPGGGLWLRRL
jgi:hypothetical protein